jgi:hypothetical protein
MIGVGEIELKGVELDAEARRFFLFESVACIVSVGVQLELDVDDELDEELRVTDRVILTAEDGVTTAVPLIELYETSGVGQ